MRRQRVAGAVLLCALLVAGCGAPSGGPALPVGEITVAVGVDLPFSGLAPDVSRQTWDAMSLYLDRAGRRAGPFRVELIQYDNAPPPNSVWDETECVRNANAHVANTHEVAVVGTYFDTCTGVQVPILNQGGPMLMVSHTDANAGLTRDTAQFAPTGRRSFARVVATDEVQGTAAARAAQTAGVTSCLVLNDGGAFGVSVASSFAAEARRLGVAVVGETAWQASAHNYRPLFDGAKNADCVFLGGVYDSNGAALVEQKAAVLGDNTRVKLLVTEGFGGYPDFLRQSAAAGAYVATTGLPLGSLAVNPDFLAEYRTRHGADLSSAAALYGVQALQLILTAIERSDGTRASVCDQIFEGGGIEIPADLAVLGSTISIDPKTGDTSVQHATIERVENGGTALVTTLQA